MLLFQFFLSVVIFIIIIETKSGKSKNFQRNYLESEKFFSKFLKVKKFQRNY